MTQLLLIVAITFIVNNASANTGPSATCNNVAECSVMADQGDVDAQIIMAMRYQHGIKVPKSIHNAIN